MYDSIRYTIGDGEPINGDAFLHEKARAEWASHAPGLDVLIKERSQWSRLDRKAEERHYAQTYYFWFTNELAFCCAFDYGY